MNTRVILLAVVLLCATANISAGFLHIKVQIESMQDSVWIHPTDKRNDGALYISNNGCMEVDYDVDEPMEVYLENPCIYRGEKGVQLFFVAVPGETLVITGTVDTGCVLGGSAFYSDYNQVYQIFVGSRHRQNAIWRKYDTFWNRDKDEAQLSLMRDRELQLENTDKQESLLKFIMSHSCQDVAAAAIPFLDDSLMRKGEALLSEEVRNGKMKEYYLPVIENLEWKKKSVVEAQTAQAPGRRVKHFTLVDINGKLCNSSDYKGKYILLDFWGSWCGACVAGFPMLKQYHEQYKDRLVIIGIGCKESEDRWRRAVSRLDAPWIHVFNGDIDSTNLMKQYAVSAFPTKILINPHLQIEKATVGEDPAFYTYLDELFK